MVIAPAKHATTIIVQIAFPKADLDLEIWPRPWTVAFSKNSDKIAKCIPAIKKLKTFRRYDGSLTYSNRPVLKGRNLPR